MRYYQLWNDLRHFDGVIQAFIQRSTDVDDYLAMKGRMIEEANIEITFLFDPKTGNKLTDLLVINLAWPLLSPRFVRVLEENNVGGIQYLTVNLQNERTGYVVHGYKVANLLNVPDALDRVHSTLYPHSAIVGHGLSGVLRYALKADKVNGLDILRIKEDVGVSIPVFVSEKFKQIVEKNKLTGCEFWQVPVYGETREEVPDASRRPRSPKFQIVVVPPEEYVLDPQALATGGETLCDEEITWDSAFEEMRRIVKLPNGHVRDGMRQLVEFCSRVQPDKSWDEIMDLRFEEDLNQLSAWVTNLLSAEPPNEDIVAYWFGLYSPVLSDGSESLGLYLCGAKEFDKDDAWHEWAVDPDYWPDGRYADSRVLCEIYRLVRGMGLDGGDSNYATEVLGLGYSALVAAELCRVVPKRLLLGGRKSRHVGVGFDEGDWMPLKSIK